MVLAYGAKGCELDSHWNILCFHEKLSEFGIPFGKKLKAQLSYDTRMKLRELILVVTECCRLIRVSPVYVIIERCP